MVVHLFRAPSFLSNLYPQLEWRMPTGQNKIYLTFDDGPVPGPTEFVLDELGQRKLKATFFCIGDNVRKYPEVFEKVKSEARRKGYAVLEKQTDTGIRLHVRLN